MYTLVMNFPEIQSEPVGRPRKCPHCGSAILQKWGRASKPLQDLDHHQAEVHRYRCTECKRTFRKYPPGIERSTRSKRLRSLAAFTWALGLSLDSVVYVFHSMGLPMSRTTIWRDGKNFGPQLRDTDQDRLVTILGVDDLSLPSRTKPSHPDRSNGNFHVEGCRTGSRFFNIDEITLILKLGRKKIFLGVVDFEGPHAARTWVQSLAADFGIEISVDKVPSPRRLMN